MNAKAYLFLKKQVRVHINSSDSALGFSVFALVFKVFALGFTVFAIGSREIDGCVMDPHGPRGDRRRSNGSARLAHICGSAQGFSTGTLR